MSLAATDLNVIRLSMRNAGRKRVRLPFEPERIYVDREVSDHPTTLAILNRLPDAEVDVVDDHRILKRPKDLGVAKSRMILAAHRGQAFKPCQGQGPGHLCCGYRVIDLISGCPMECSYCILQSYLENNPVTTVYVNLEAILAELGSFLDSNRERFFRIGTGELSDSLALDPIIDYASVLVSFFAKKRNALLELKTKTAYVDHLLGVEHRGRTVISWSVNTPAVIDSEERGVASLDERLDAARRAADAGYGVGFHFDPIIVSGSIEETVGRYLEVVERILDEVPLRRVSWVSLGLLRYPPSLPKVALKRFPDTTIFTGELVPVGRKVRYHRFMRGKVLGPLWETLAAKIPRHKLYLCMETPAVWRGVDEGVHSSACIAGRLCNTEPIGGCF